MANTKESLLNYSSADSSGSETEDELDAVMAESESAGGEIGGVNRKSGWFGTSSSGKKGKLSIQSGDIMRTPTPVSPSDPAATIPPGPPLSPSTGTTIPSSGSNGITRFLSSTSTGLHATVFKITSKVVFFEFFSVKLSRYCLLPIASPLLLLLNLIVIGAFAAVSAVYYPPSINLSIKSFGIPNHPAQMNWDAFSAAREDHFFNASKTRFPTPDEVRRRRSVPPIPTPGYTDTGIFPNCAGHSQYALHTSWEMDLIFRVPEPNPNKNILSRKHIARIHKIEDMIYNSTEYKHYCHKTSNGICDPLNSLLTWLYPRDKNTGQYIYHTSDGDDYGFTGDLEGTLKNLSANLSVALWFTAGDIYVNGSTVEAKILRSQIRVGLPLPCYNGVYDRIDEQNKRVNDYFVSLMPILEGYSTSEVEVLYGSPSFFDLQVIAAVKHDAVLAAISAGLVIILMFILSGFSIWLTFAGLYSIISCFVPAYFCYRVIFNFETVGLLNVISIFVIIGIGVDDVFVFINTFKQSARLPDLETPQQRLTYTILESSKATFFTSLTTAVAFFANAVSSIPAVQQFGVFMGLVVIFCFIQVFLVIPHCLFIWHCLFLKLENCCYYPFHKLIGLLYGCCHKENTIPLPPVRMSQIPDDNDSGIDTVSSSNSDDISSNSSNQSDSSNSELIVRDGDDDFDEDVVALISDSALPPTVPPTATPTTLFKSVKTAEGRLTLLMQTGMLYISTIPMVLHLCTSKFSNKKQSLSLFIVNILLSIISYSAVIGISVALMVQLRVTDHPPQFFDPNSNLQKMLDLAGNLTDDTVNCYDCNAWNSNGYTPPSTHGGGGQPTRSPPPSTHPSSAPFTSHPYTRTYPRPPTTSPTTHHTPHYTPPFQHTTPTPRTTTKHVKTRPPTTAPLTPPPMTTPRPLGTTPTPRTSGGSTPIGLTTTSSPTTPAPGGQHLTSSLYKNNEVIYAVFGVQSVKRNYSTSHVLPEGGEGTYAILDPRFSDLFTCPYRQNNAGKLRGTMRALCRICSNISNPDNGLVLKGNFQCLPPLQSFSRMSCLSNIVYSIPECSSLLYTDTSNVSVRAEVHTAITDDNYHIQISYLAMAFRSTSNQANSPFDSEKDYQKWKSFLSSELEAVMAKSSIGEAYEGAEVLSTAFQTSEYWVQVNIQVVAVDGSIYGIALSFILCSIVVLMLAACDYRVVLSMVLTISAILVSLIALFWCFKWKLGIVEAISLSILVGNSLDYCIHLSEGYIAMDSRHIAFVERFKFTAGAPVRVKRVMAAISFIGVSIISSAITTILAIIPLLGTQIQLFTRFGQILLLDTAVAIVYTLVICSVCLSFFGPPQKEKIWKKLLNAGVTTGVTVVLYVVVLLVLKFVSLAGVYIPSPQGGELFH